MSARPCKAVRLATAAAATVLLLSLQGCVFFLPNSYRAFTQLRKVQNQVNKNSLAQGAPEVQIVLNAAGGDAINVYLPNAASKRFRIAEAAATWLGASGTPPAEDTFEPDTATVQLHRRLVTRSADGWTTTLETGELQRAVSGEGYEGFDLFVCHPAIETRFNATRPPDYGEGDTTCLRGVGWIVDDNPLKVGVAMLPRSIDYFRFLAGAVLGLVLFGGLAWFVGNALRHGSFRRRSPGAVALGLVAGGLAAAGGVVAVAAVGGAAGPGDNLALAKDLPVGLYALAIGLPALAGAIPGIIFAMLLVRRRPWPDEPEPEQLRQWPAPPPPGGAGPPSPPPLPWGVR